MVPSFWVGLPDLHTTNDKVVELSLWNFVTLHSSFPALRQLVLNCGCSAGDAFRHLGGMQQLVQLS
jgi:hypothetical protein